MIEQSATCKYREVRTLEPEFKQLSFDSAHTVSPFKYKLRPSGLGGRSRIRTLGEDSETIVRVDYPFARDVRTIRKRLNTGKAVFQELEEFGISVLPMDFVIGRYTKDGSGFVYTITKRVDGENLDKINLCEIERNGFQSSADQFFVSLVKYYRHVMESGGIYFSDLKNDQFVYGKAKDDLQNKIYLVDIDPEVSHHIPRSKGGPANSFFYRTLKKAGQMIKAMEERLEEPLPESSEELKELVKKLPNSLRSSDTEYLRKMVG